jgi:acyl dehydratase
MTQLNNFTYEELALGQTASYTKTVTEQDIQLFAIVSGDVNPVHLDSDYAATTPFNGPIAHGMLTGAVVSAAIALQLPGPGTIYLGQNLRFRLPVRPDDTLTVKLEVTELKDKRQQVALDCKVFNQDDKLVASGLADVMAPTQKLSMQAPSLPRVTLTG